MARCRGKSNLSAGSLPQRVYVWWNVLGRAQRTVLAPGSEAGDRSSNWDGQGCHSPPRARTSSSDVPSQPSPKLPTTVEN